MQPLLWKSKESKKEITSLEALLQHLSDLRQEIIDVEIVENLPGIISWLESNFREIDLVTSLKSSQKEFTPQQMRELMVRKLRVLLQKKA
jgi:hypothetical protein